jgi:PQQ-dependent dehydrogenase (s-GDH family)
MGMALHPQLLQGQPYVYLAYVYRFLGSKANLGGNYFRTKIVRYTYDVTAQTLNSPATVCDTLPGSTDHNGGRLLIATINKRNYLFYSVGDMGAGQFDNAARPSNAQNVQSYEGKILRFNIQPDADPDTVAAWIPNDNPFNSQTKQSAVYSYGHRNPQGLAYNLNNHSFIYTAEHGPFSDDEINRIEAGKNYGHPLVIGYNDDNYNGLSAGVTNHLQVAGKWHSSSPFIVSESANAKSLGNRYRDPIKSFNPSRNSFLQNIFKATRAGAEPKPEWPSIAPSSIELYTSDVIPGWRNSLLITTLKTGSLIRLQLNESGKAVKDEALTYFQSSNRYRDIAISPDGNKIYLITDFSSVTSGPTKEDPQSSSQKGAILEFTFDGKK